MKRIGGVICLIALIVTMTVTAAFGAQSLELKDSYPRNDQKNTTIENMSVKLEFNQEMGSKANRKANADCFKITDDKGRQIPIRVFYDPENSHKVMVLADALKIHENKDLTIKDNTTYTLHIASDLQDNNGNKLGKEKTVSFTTLNQKRNTQVYMLMMVIMFGGMFLFSSRQMKKQAEKQDDGKAKEEPFNPYKEAKKTGKSIDEVIAAHEKEMEKKAAKDAKKAARRKDEEDDYEEEEDNGNYKVKGPRPISAGGGTYITGRKALAEARAAEEERLAKRRAANAKKKKKK